jgi:hypothetical protein
MFMKSKLAYGMFNKKMIAVLRSLAMIVVHIFDRNNSLPLSVASSICPAAACLAIVLGFTSVAIAAPAVTSTTLGALANAGFEKAGQPAGLISSADYWTPYGSGYSLVNDVYHSGGRAIRCVAGDSSSTYGAHQTIVLDQKSAVPVTITGWSRAADVDGESDADYSIYADIVYTDGTPLWGSTTSFDTGTHGWQERKLLILPDKPIRQITVYALFRNHAGSVWFDDFNVSDEGSALLFDDQPILPPSFSQGKNSGWFIRDVAASSPILALKPGSSTLGVSAIWSHTASSGPTTFLTLRNRTDRSRAVSVYFVERFAPENVVWYNDIRSQKPATGDGEYSNVTQLDAGAAGTISLYPFGCVTGGGTGQALAIPPQLGPRIARIVYNAKWHLLFAVFDIALTPAKSGKHSGATVAIAKYPIDPKWGFRSAAATYYKMFPASFINRAGARGIWMPFTDPSTVQNSGDFHFGYHEGSNSVPFDRAHGILSFTYIEPMSYWMAMPKAMPRKYEVAVAYLKQLAAQTKDLTAQRNAEAVLYSGTVGSDGHYNVSFRNTPWCDGAVWTLNPNPNLPRSSGAWTKATLNESAEPVAGKPDQPDGVYLDSLEMMADVLDYRPASLDATSLPLTFVNDQPRPLVPTWFSVYEAAKALSNSLHARKKLLMANTVLWRFSAFTPVLDVMGTETNMFGDNGEFEPDTDAIMNYRRTMAYHKPYLLLMNTDFTKVGYIGMQHYFERSLFYDIFPSMFSVDAADNPYWASPALYNRDRPLFKMIPLIQQLSRAGWEPITDAWTVNADVLIERYGRDLYTVLNQSSTAITTTLRFDANQRLQINGKKAADSIVRDEITGETMPASGDGNVSSVTIHIAPYQAMLLNFDRGNKIGLNEGEIH